MDIARSSPVKLDLSVGRRGDGAESLSAGFGDDGLRLAEMRRMSLPRVTLRRCGDAVFHSNECPVLLTSERHLLCLPLRSCRASEPLTG
jgi:hypothetical protein